MLYLYDGTYDGLLSAIFVAFDQKENPDDILSSLPEQIGFFHNVRLIETDTAHARRVESGIERAMGTDALSYVFAAQHSAEECAGAALLAFLRRGFKVGTSIFEHLSDDAVIRVMRMARHVWWESTRWRQFLRFHELENGVFIAQYEPENDVTELLMPHFADRFCVQPFLIHDRVRQKAGVYRNGLWMLASSRNMELPKESEDEARYQRLWTRFCDVVSIRERENPSLRRQMMPKKFWKDMVEMQGKRQ